MRHFQKCLYIGLFFLSPELWAQEGIENGGGGTFSHLQSSPRMAYGDDRLHGVVDATGFFQNSEFFSPLAVGQTLPGIQFVPRLAFQIEQFRLEWGAYAVYYAGDKQNNDAFNQMFIRMQYAVNPDFNLVLGNLYGGLSHRLIEPLYQWERHYTAHPEHGLQVHFENKKYFADVWLDWEQFIRRGDSIPELLTFGISTSVLLTSPDEDSQFRLSVPLQLLVHHQGGQIDTSDKPKIVMGNVAAGINAEWFAGYNLLQSLALKTYITGYLDNTEDLALRPFTKGWGIYPVLEARAKYFTMAVGYWHANKFYAFGGESLFGSFNPYEPEKQFPIRDLVTAKLLYQKVLLHNLHAGAQVEIYRDCGLQRTDYSFGVYLRFNSQLF